MRYAITRFLSRNRVVTERFWAAAEAAARYERLSRLGEEVTEPRLLSLAETDATARRTTE